jgi:outer membrane receptor for ferrienterochelin and colicins
MRALVALALWTPSFLHAQQDSTKTRAVPLDPIVVTAERRPTRASDAKATVRVVSQAEIQRRALSDLPTLLRDVPGVQLDPVVGSGAGVMLQGLGSDRVLVLLDGAPIAGRISGELDLTRFDPRQFERVEIVEGPQSTLYGSSALGGVVNLLTRTDLTRRVELSSQIAEFNQRDVHGRVSGLFGAVGGALEIGRRTTDVVPGRAATTAGFANRWDGMARARRGSSDLRLLGVQENQLYRTGSNYNLNDNWQLDLLSQTTFGAAQRTELRVHGSAYDHRFVTSTTPDPSGGTPDWDKQRVADIELVHRGGLAQHTWLTGAKIEREWLTSARITGRSRAAWSGAVYSSADWTLGSVAELATGVRVTASEIWGTTLAPRAAITVRPVGTLQVKLGVARGFRAPSFKEQYTDFLNAGMYAVHGNPDLEPEHSWNESVEVALSGTRGRVYVRGFANQLRNFIETRVTGDTAGVPLFEYQNVGRARTNGAEVGFLTTRGIAEVSASYAYLDTKDEATGNELLGRARNTARLAAGISPGRFNLRAEVLSTSRVPLSRSGTTTRYQEAYTRLNLTSSATLATDLQLNTGVDNVADSRPVGAATERGRRWFAGLSWGVSW